MEEVYYEDSLSEEVSDRSKKRCHIINNLSPVQKSNFTCSESNANEKNLVFSLICLRFGTCEVRRLNRALLTSLSRERTGEYWISVVFVLTSLRLVRTATTSGQYSRVRPSGSVSKRLFLSLSSFREFTRYP